MNQDMHSPKPQAAPPKAEACPLDQRHQRTLALLGQEGFARLKSASVAVAGLGGVGGYCAEALARSGVGRLTLIDGDRVAPSNLNRQLFATQSTLGMEKTRAAALRLSDVSDARLTLRQLYITAETVGEAVPADADFVVDAIDSIQGKLALILFCRDQGIPIVSCMGAGCRTDPTAFTLTDIYSTANDPLARRMRQELRRLGVPSLAVVASSQLPKPREKDAPLGSFAPAVGAAGLALAGYVIQRLSQGSGAE